MWYIINTMRRVRLGIIGAGAVTEWAILPALSGPDAVSPPDTGAWWSRRPSSHSVIRYQAPSLPEVVAIADVEPERAERVAQAARVRAAYGDWRRMLREVQIDALICAATPEIAGEVAIAANSAVNWLWVYGPPSASVTGTLRLTQRLEGRALHIWCARPLRYAAAHRAARQLLEREEIGAVSALTLRWGTSLYVPDKAESEGALAPDDALHLSSAYAAFDLLLGLGSHQNGSAVPVRVLAHEMNRATTLQVHFASGLAATALFAGAESWNSPLPRLEICGTEGRSIICEAGRRLWLHKPQEATRFMEPPGLATHVSTANLIGVAEDLKTFLAACVEDIAADGVKREPSVEFNAAAMPVGAARALQILEAAADSLANHQMVDIQPLREANRRQVMESVAPDIGEEVKKNRQDDVSYTLPLQL
ncbi:MAG: Gfo/Idh/MocA family oxidoreductase [Abitibacteriaceae bacterium]|nr:Gfo/Idh/MocA family oxidoreductase [Abditibacteriaceae bacterium]